MCLLCQIGMFEGIFWRHQMIPDHSWTKILEQHDPFRIWRLVECQRYTGASTKARALDWQTCDWAREQKVDSWACGPESAEWWVHQAQVWLCRIHWHSNNRMNFWCNLASGIQYIFSFLTQVTLEQQNQLWVPGSCACTKAGTEVLPEGKAKPTCLHLEDVRRSLLEKLKSQIAVSRYSSTHEETMILI